ncbi:MAG: hypothetical protein ACR2QX_11355 [Woeseiaceae bacterium]
MRSLIPVLAVILALIAAGSIAYVAWDLTSDKSPDERDDEEGGDPAGPQEPGR